MASQESRNDCFQEKQMTKFLEKNAKYPVLGPFLQKLGSTLF